tara:strand:+ start:477 stop:1187 length:711 start_codon:yes stop_codon:yes gene_type:complete
MNTKLLVSFKKLKEINRNLNYVDIIDLKNPLNGAIGSWNSNEIIKAIKIYGKRKSISATLGNLKEPADIVFKLHEFDEFGLDFIKFGIFTNNLLEIENLFKSISEKSLKTKIVAVFFAENKKSLNFFSRLNQYNIRNVLIDTYAKDSLDLLNLCSIDFLSKLIKKLKQNNIKIGLAGKLKENQIPQLIDLNPDLIGLRSAVCMQNNRKGEICMEKLKKLSFYFKDERRKATEYAGA